MEKILIGYKQGDQTYVYVSQIDKYNVGITTIIDGALDFNTNKIAQTVCEYLNIEDNEHTYLPIKVTIKLEEVENDVITSE